MDLITPFIVGFFCGCFSLHILYLTYFHIFILGRIEKGIIETKLWIDGHINSQSSASSSSIFSLFEKMSYIKYKSNL
jgi:hypothetical protein